MAFKVIWSKEAEDTFELIIHYLNKNWTAKEIQKIIIETNRVVSILEQNPYLFRCSEKMQIFEVMIGKQNLLLYQVDKKHRRVELLSFWDARQNPKTKLKNK